MNERRSPDSAVIFTYGFLWYIIYLVVDLIAVVIREVPGEGVDLVYIVTMSVLKWLLVVPLAWIATAAVAGIWHLRWPERPDSKGERRAIFTGALVVSAVWLLLGLVVNTGWLDWDASSQAFPPGMAGSLVHGCPLFVATLAAALVTDFARGKGSRRSRGH
jgi:hypothetical protein